MLSLKEALRPLYPMTVLTITSTLWALKTDALEQDPRAFLLAFGTIFSNIAVHNTLYIFYFIIIT